MYRRFFISVSFIILPFTSLCKEKNYKPFLKEVSQLDTLFKFFERNDTLFLIYGESSHRIELVKNRLNTITPLSAKGQINGLRRTYKFKRNSKYWPNLSTNHYSEDKLISEYYPKLTKLVLIDAKTSEIDTVELDANNQSIFISNDSLNKASDNWRIGAVGMPHLLSLTGSADSIKSIISFRHGYFHTIGTFDIRKGRYDRSFYLFDYGKLIFKFNLSNRTIIGRHKFYYKEEEYHFECEEDKYNCYCDDSEIKESKLFNPKSKYFYLKETNEGIAIILSSYSYYTLLKFEL